MLKFYNIYACNVVFNYLRRCVDHIIANFIS